MSTYTSRPVAGGGRTTPTVSHWIVGNFKALQHVSVDFAPLNLLTGANSSGKSSLIQSLLLLAQSTDDEIILNGTLVRLGDSLDVIRTGTNELTLSYTTRSRMRGEEPSEWSFELRLAPEGSSLRVTDFYAACDGQPVIEATSSRVTPAAREEVNPGNRFGEAMLRVRELNGRRAPAKTYLGFHGFYPQLLIFRRQPRQVLSALRRSYGVDALRENPEKAFLLYDEIAPWLRSTDGPKPLPERLAKRVGETGRPDRGPGGFLFDLDQTELETLFQAFSQSISVDQWVPIPVTRYGGAYRPFGMRAGVVGLPTDPSPAMRALAVADDSLRGLRESIRYLGPLREEPQVVSATGGRNRSVPAGPKGEYTADLLARAKNDVVAFRDWDGNDHREKLPQAVSLWTTYLGVGDTVAVEDQGKLGRGLRIRVNGVERDLTTVGVGASQVLPVLTVVLAASPGSLVLLEQPELHLHPAVQSRLADFFLMARPDIRIVVETHSEYLISRLRRRVAEGRVGSDRVSIMFAEQLEGATHIRRLHVSPLGDLNEWPAGFFDEQDEEARAIVKAVHRGRMESNS